MASFPAGRALPAALAWLIAFLTLLRVITAACLPLSFDEAYFWLWSRHLAISYFEHPPLIALAIRAGTALLGDTSLGVRLIPLLASIAASFALWRAAVVIFEDHTSAWTACAFFNLTLMMASQGMGATPDVFVLMASAWLLWCVAELERTDYGWWWLVAVLALGVALLAKYTAFFLALSLAFWLIAAPRGRRWLASPWPYAAALLALTFLGPNLVWNQAHHWISFAYQFGRIGAERRSSLHLLEFFASQLALASPIILVLALITLGRETRKQFQRPLGMSAALVWPGLLYFCLHSLHDRVQGNWPSFIYPGLAILAAAAVKNAQGPVMRWSGRLAVPVASLILAFSYLQTWTGLLPVGKVDPIARMTAVGFGPIAEKISALARSEHAAALVTTRYVNTGWLAFYVRPHLAVLQAAEEYRWTDVPAAGPKLLNSPLVYVTEHPERELRFVQRYFSRVIFSGCSPRMRSGVRVDNFCLYTLRGLRPNQATRIPIAYSP
jgi:4-amino-4-deoxy-L-arabinose transferase-like glycosyltransferase